MIPSIQIRAAFRKDRSGSHSLAAFRRRNSPRLSSLAARANAAVVAAAAVVQVEAAQVPQCGEKLQGLQHNCFCWDHSHSVEATTVSGLVVGVH